MKTLNWPLFTFLILLISFNSAYSQFKSGMELGGNIMNADFTIQDPIDTEQSWGIRMGWVGEYRTPSALYFRGATLINQRGFQFADERWALNTFDIPLNVGLGLNLNQRSLRWFLDAGLNVEYNFDGFTKIDGETVKLSIGNGEDDIKRFSQGYNIGTGLQISENFKFRINYYQGLTNLLRTEGDDWSSKVIGISLNYFFNSRV